MQQRHLSSCLSLIVNFSPIMISHFLTSARVLTLSHFCSLLLLKMSFFLVSLAVVSSNSLSVFLQLSLLIQSPTISCIISLSNCSWLKPFRTLQECLFLFSQHYSISRVLHSTVVQGRKHIVLRDPPNTLHNITNFNNSPP